MALRLERVSEIPPVIKNEFGIGKSKAKVIQKTDGTLLVKAVQDIGTVIVRLTLISDKDKARSLEINEDELRKVMLMCRDLRGITHQPSEVEAEEVWLEE
jgi:hypothetical protein